jgi:hypothetical protein
MNENFKTALEDLIQAIQKICLGSIESKVIEGACLELFLSWDDYNDDYLTKKDEVEFDLMMDELAKGVYQLPEKAKPNTALKKRYAKNETIPIIK